VERYGGKLKGDDMDIYEYAMQLEKNGEDHYRRMAENTGDKGLKSIYSMLADDEVRHLEFFGKMKEDAAAVPSDTGIVDAARNVFSDIAESTGGFSESISQKELYEKALDLEEKTRKLYLDKASETDDDNLKKALQKIADQEQKHYNVIDRLLGFIKEPETFLENAEFFNSEEYWMMREE
jgi:rubrerythrin